MSAVMLGMRSKYPARSSVARAGATRFGFLSKDLAIVPTATLLYAWQQRRGPKALELHQDSDWTATVR